MNLNFNFYKMSSLTEKINNMFKSIFILTMYSIISGSMFMWLVFSESSLIMLFLENKLLTLLMVMIGIWMSYEMSHSVIIHMSLISEFLGLMWYMKQISTFHNQFMIFNYSINFQKSTHMGWGEYYGPQGIMIMVKYINIFNMKIIENNFKIQMIYFIIWMMMMFM